MTPHAVRSALCRTNARWAVVFTIAVLQSAQSQDDLRPPGELVDVGGYRIHLWCIGPIDSGPTVVLSSGAGGYALDWALVQPVVAESRRVCSYDRANYGFSDVGPSPRTLRQEAAELHAALNIAGERPPYVVVGQSMGGVVVRVFTRDYPDDVVGVVLVDAPSENTRLGFRGEFLPPRTRASDRPVPAPRSLAEGPPVALTGDAADQCRSAAASARVFGPYLKLPQKEQQMLLWFLQHPKCFVGDEYLAEELAQIFRDRATNPQPFGALPLIVLNAGASSTPPGVDASEWRAEKLDDKADLARLSSEGRLVTDPTSGHFIHFDNPGLVVNAITEVVEQASRRAD